MTDTLLIHPTSIILEDVNLGNDVKIGAHCLVENNVVIGNRTTIKSGVQIGKDIAIGDDVFIGPNVTLANDHHLELDHNWSEPMNTLIEDGVSIGGGATLVAGITIGKNALVAPGTVVTKSVPAFTIVKGNPGRVSGYVDRAAPSGGEQRANVIKLNNVPARGELTTVSLGAGDAFVRRLKYVDDLRGNLSVGEFPSDIPFEPKRYFLVFDVPNQEVRGSHAHKVCKQFLVCIKGSVNVMVDDGNVRSEVVLDSPDLGVYIPPMVWGTQYRYSEDAVLLVFASHIYDDADYIRKYKDFQQLTNN